MSAGRGLSLICREPRAWGWHFLASAAGPNRVFPPPGSALLGWSHSSCVSTINQTRVTEFTLKKSSHPAKGTGQFWCFPEGLHRCFEWECVSSSARQGRKVKISNLEPSCGFFSGLKIPQRILALQTDNPFPPHLSPLS